MSEINLLIQKLEAEFDELKPGELKPDTNFRTLKDWGSMHALIIIALVDTEYGVMLSGEELKSISTIQQLYDFIVLKKS